MEAFNYLDKNLQIGANTTEHSLRIALEDRELELNEQYLKQFENVIIGCCTRLGSSDLGDTNQKGRKKPCFFLSLLRISLAIDMIFYKFIYLLIKFRSIAKCNLLLQKSKR